MIFTQLRTNFMIRIHISTKQWPLAHTEAQGLAEGRLRDGRQEPAALRLLLGLQRHRIARGTALQEVGKSGEEGLQRILVLHANVVNQSFVLILSMSLTCLTFVHFLTFYCPIFVSCPVPDFVLSRFVLIKSSSCPLRTNIVQLLSPFSPKYPCKIKRHKVDKFKTQYFSHLLPGHTAIGQKLDKIWT